MRSPRKAAVLAAQDVGSASIDLFRYLDGRQSPERLLPQSETLFIGAGQSYDSGLGYEFVVGEKGVATHVIELHVPDAYTYPRVSD